MAEINLSKYGITGTTEIVHNPSYELLFEEETRPELEGFEKVSEVSNNIIYPMWIEDGMDLCLETLDHLLTHVPVYELVNKADEDSVLMVKQVVFDEKN